MKHKAIEPICLFRSTILLGQYTLIYIQLSALHNFLMRFNFFFSWNAAITINITLQYSYSWAIKAVNLTDQLESVFAIDLTRFGQLDQLSWYPHWQRNIALFQRSLAPVIIGSLQLLQIIFIDIPFSITSFLIVWKLL